MPARVLDFVLGAPVTRPIHTHIGEHLPRSDNSRYAHRIIYKLLLRAGGLRILTHWELMTLLGYAPPTRL
jgi:hypothetical protein